MNCIDVIKSQKDKTVKYVFDSFDSILEFSYINKDDGKDIVCVPTQTTCNLGCKFCFLTGLKIPQRNLQQQEIINGVEYVIKKSGTSNRVLLISFMGCGEPLFNIDSVIDAARYIRASHDRDYYTVRFAVASLIPKHDLFKEFETKVMQLNLKCKFHYSLHTTDPVVRKSLMPGAAPICLDLIYHYVESTNNSAEIHYSLMNDVNDDVNDATRLIELLKGKPIAVKLLKLSEKPGDNLSESKRIKEFQAMLEVGGITTEYYEPPGSDVGSSCGQFLLDYYQKYAKK
jgi:23S rRNA (adenine2503-C2)-methyltransferase